METLSHTLPDHLASRRSAQRREHGVQLAAIGVALTSLLGAGLMLRPINRLRLEHQLVVDPDSIAGLPPGIALLGKLGTFRALAIDWAFIRVERLKTEGKDYEALQLGETICALAPRYPKVWTYHAWNMAYNISVAQYTPQDRWQWVYNGIKILRDKAIQYNPRNVRLYKELAWIYWHKVGDFIDDYHQSYKRMVAFNMERILGPPPAAASDQEHFAWFKKIVDAPRDWSAFVADDAEVAELIRRLKSVKLSPDYDLLEFVARHIRPELRAADLVDPKLAVDNDSLTARRLALCTDAAWQEPLDRLLAALRSKVLREDEKFDLDYLYKLMTEQYGPLDLRNSSSHALYWAARGDEVAKGHEASNENQAMQNARLVFFSVNDLVTRGHLTFQPDFDDPFQSYLERTPDTRYIPYVYDAYMRLGKEQFSNDPRYRAGTPGPNYMTGFVTSMHNWIQYLVLEGGDRNRRLAEQLFAWLRENNPHPDGSTQERYLQTLESFVMEDILENLDTWRSTQGIIRSLVRRTLSSYALGQILTATRSLKLALMCYDYWMLETTKDINERRKIQPPDIVLRDEIYSFFEDQRIKPIAKARLWKYLPLEHRQAAYDGIRPAFQRICSKQDPPWSEDRAFREPPGMAEYRKKESRYRRPPTREDVKEGTRYKKD